MPPLRLLLRDPPLHLRLLPGGTGDGGRRTPLVRHPASPWASSPSSAWSGTPSCSSPPTTTACRRRSAPARAPSAARTPVRSSAKCSSRWTNSSPPTAWPLRRLPAIRRPAAAAAAYNKCGRRQKPSPIFYISGAKMRRMFR